MLEITEARRDSSGRLIVEFDDGTRFETSDRIRSFRDLQELLLEQRGELSYCEDRASLPFSDEDEDDEDC